MRSTYILLLNLARTEELYHRQELYKHTYIWDWIVCILLTLQQLFERAILISIAVEKIWRADDAIESVAGRSMHAKKEGSMARRAKSKYAAAGISEGHANKTVWLRLYKLVP